MVFTSNTVEPSGETTGILIALTLFILGMETTHKYITFTYYDFHVMEKLEIC